MLNFVVNHPKHILRFSLTLWIPFLTESHYFSPKLRFCFNCPLFCIKELLDFVRRHFSVESQDSPYDKDAGLSARYTAVKERPCSYMELLLCIAAVELARQR